MDRTHWPLNLLALALAALAVVVAHQHLPYHTQQRFTVEAELSTLAGGEFELFVDEGQDFQADRSSRARVVGDLVRQRVRFVWPTAVEHVRGLRLDPGDTLMQVALHALHIRGPGGTLTWRTTELKDLFTAQHGVRAHPIGTDALMLDITGTDPWIATDPDVLRDHLEPALHSWPPLAHWSIDLLLGTAVFGLARWGLRGASRALARAPAVTQRTIGLTVLFDGVVLLAAFGIAQRVRPDAKGVDLSFEVIIPKNDLFQLFYAYRPRDFAAIRSDQANVKGAAERQWVRFTLPIDSLPTALRFDPGQATDSVVITGMAFGPEPELGRLDLFTLRDAIDGQNDISGLRFANGGITLHFGGKDPYITLTDAFRDRMIAALGRDTPWILPLVAAALATLLIHAGLQRSGRIARIAEQASGRELTFAAVFVGLLSLPLLSILHPGIEPRQRFSERRLLAELPALRLRALGTYPTDFDAWYRDHFGFRRDLFRWNSWMHVFGLRTSPLPDKLVVGRDGWLFQYDPVLDDNYRGAPLFGFEDLERIRLQAERQQRWLAARGIRYYLFVAPMNSTVNAEHLPARFHRERDARWVSAIRAHFDRYSTVPFIDPTDALIAGKKERETYFATDIHWNPYGAYIGYRTLIDRLRADDPRIPAPWSESDLRFRVDTNDQADIAHMLGLADVIPRVEPMIEPLRARHATFSHYPWFPTSMFFLDKAQTFSNPDTTLPRILVFHDSFGLYLKPLLNEHFSRSTYVWYPLFLPEVAQQEQPDIVVHELLERFLVNLPQDTVALP